MFQFYRCLVLLVASLVLSNAHEVRLSFDDASLQYQPSVCNEVCGTTCDKQWFDECPQGPKSERMTKVDQGTSLQFDFQGDSIAWHSRVFPLGGVAYISIDGGASETVDTSSSASRPDNDDAVVWTKTGLDSTKTHHVVIHFDSPTTPAKLRIRADETSSATEAATSAKSDGEKTEGAGTSKTSESVPASSVAASESSPSPTPSASEQPLSTSVTSSASDPILSVKAEPTPTAAPGSPPPALPPTLPAGGASQPAPPSRPGRPGPGEGDDRHGRPGHEGEGPGQASPPAAPQPPAAPPAPPAPAPPQQPAPPAPAPPAAAPQPPAQAPAQPPAQQAPQPPAQPPAAAAPAPPAQAPVVPAQPGNAGQANPVGSQVQIAPLPSAASPLAPAGSAAGILAGGPNRFISIKQFVITVPDGIASASPADPTNINATGGDSPQSSSQDPTVNMAAIGGGVAAGVVLLALLGGFFFVERRKKLKRKRDSDPFAGTDAHESKWRQLPDDVEAQRNSGPSITVSPPGVGRRTTIIHRSEVISQQPSLASQNPSLAIPESIISGQPSSVADAPPGEFLEKSEIEAYNYRWSIFAAPQAGAIPPAAGHRSESQ